MVDKAPPGWARKLLTRLHPEDTLEEVEGDLEELYEYWYERSGKTQATLKYVFNVITVLPPFVRRRQKEKDYYKPSIISIDMIRNYFKIAFRNLLRYRLNSGLTIMGLAMGLACSVMIILHVKEELSYDKGFSKADRIYRVNTENIGEITRRWAATSPLLAVEMQKEIPSIETIARFHRPYPDRVFTYSPSLGDPVKFEEKRGFYADSTVVDVFELPFVKGDPSTALKQLDAIVLTEAMAKRYFGNQEPLGKFIRDDLNDRFLTVTGVISDFSFPTHLPFDYLISMSTFYKYAGDDQTQSRGWAGFYNYVVLNDHSSIKATESKLTDFMLKFYLEKGEKKENILAERKLYLQPVTDIHLHSALEKEMGPNSDIKYVYIFSVAALFILLVAAVNFINMATAQAFNRTREVGMRKVLGAKKSQLIKQFLGESVLMTFFAVILALLLFRLALPFYNEITAKNLFFGQLFTPDNLLILSLVVVLISLVAGMYPAWFISNFEPLSVLKGKRSQGSSVKLINKGLIVFQFAVSVFMIFSTVVVYRQTRFFQTQKLGFDQDQVVAFKMYGQIREKSATIQNELLKNAGITSVARVSNLPGDRIGTEVFTLAGKSGEGISMRLMWADENAIPALKINMKSGRNFTRQAEAAPPSFLLNEAAAKVLKLNDPVGQKMTLWGNSGEILGVVKDFNVASLHSAVEPLVIAQMPPSEGNYFLLKIKGDNLNETVKAAQAAVSLISPESLFSYTFLDAKLNHLYDSETRITSLLRVFAMFAIFISCLGLFGLSTYAAQLRTREVGIRKALGATVSGIVVLLSSDFMWLIFIAILLASPLAWWAMNQWLQEFAYAIEIEWWMFVIAGFTTVGIALLTVGFQAVKAAVVNPLKSLRSE